MQRYIVLISFCLWVVSAKWKPDPPPEDSTATPVVESHPVYIQARKMAKLMVNQNVVTTCRYMLFKTPMKFHDALNHCRNLNWPISHSGTDMATVQNQDENSDIVSLLRLAFGVKFDRKNPYKYGNWVLIGLSKRYENNRPLLDKEKGVFNMTQWYYSNNERARFGNFHRGMPDQQSMGRGKKKQYQNWVHVNRKGFWDDTFSTKPKPFACNYCGKYIVLSKHVRWDKARQLCESFGLEFATVRSKQDNEELLFAANVSLGSHLSERRFNNSNWVWIGEYEVMNADNTGSNQWAHYNENKPFEKWEGFNRIWYSTPRLHQPDNWTINRKGGRTEQRVVAISRENGLWDDSFVHRKRPFACQCPERACHM